MRVLCGGGSCHLGDVLGGEWLGDGDLREGMEVRTRR